MTDIICVMSTNVNNVYGCATVFRVAYCADTRLWMHRLSEPWVI